jgi:ATP-dependent Lon protease
MPLAVAREASVRLVEEANASGKLIGVFTQREGRGRRAAAGRSLSGRHRDPHPQDVQAAGRQPAADRPGRRTAHARSHRPGAAVPARRGHGRARPARDEDLVEIDALQRNIKSNFQQVVSLSPLLSDDLQTLAANITDPASSPTSSPRAWRPSARR